MENKIAKRNYSNFVKKWENEKQGTPPSFDEWIEKFAEETMPEKMDDVPENACPVCGTEINGCHFDSREADHERKIMTVKYVCEKCKFIGLLNYRFSFLDHEPRYDY